MKPKIMIGLPVYNGEKTISKTLDSIISQTYREFILTISDNASTDSTQTICEKYTKRDQRIHYVRQSKNMGPLWNVLYLLNNAESDYFVWIAADDFWEPTFLEKNIKILDTNKDVVASTGKTAIVGNYYQKFICNQNDNAVIKFYKKVRLYFLSFTYGSVHGQSYEDRIKSCFKSYRYALSIYSVFRTDVLKKSSNQEIIPWDWAVILLVLKHGNLHVIDEILLHRSLGGGTSNTNAIYNYRHNYITFKQLIFPKLPFTKWCLKNLGKRIFCQNVGFFIKINCTGPFIILLDFIKYLKSPSTKRLYYTEKN